MHNKKELQYKLKQKICIKRLDNVYCKLKPSHIHGVGIFAIKDIPININPFKDSYLGQDGIVLDKNDILYKNLQDEEKKLLEDYHPTNKSNIQYISYFPNQLIWTNYLNYVYDDRANIKLLENGEWITTRKIYKDEELLENPNDLFNSDGSHKIYKVKKNTYRNIS